MFQPDSTGCKEGREHYALVCGGINTGGFNTCLGFPELVLRYGEKMSGIKRKGGRRGEEECTEGKNKDSVHLPFPVLAEENSRLYRAGWGGTNRLV